MSMRLLQKNAALKSDLQSHNLWREFCDRAESAFARNKAAGQTRAGQAALAEMAALGKIPMAWVDRMKRRGNKSKKVALVREAEYQTEKLKRAAIERVKRDEAEIQVAAANLEIDPNGGGVVDPIKAGSVDLDWENALGGKKINVVDDAVWAYVHLSCKSVSAKAAPSAMAFQMYRDLRPLTPAQRLDVMKVIIGSAARKSDGEGKGEDEFRGTTEFNLLEEMARVK